MTLNYNQFFNNLVKASNVWHLILLSSHLNNLESLQAYRWLTFLVVRWIAHDYLTISVSRIGLASFTFIIISTTLVLDHIFRDIWFPSLWYIILWLTDHICYCTYWHLLDTWLSFYGYFHQYLLIYPRLIVLFTYILHSSVDRSPAWPLVLCTLVLAL